MFMLGELIRVENPEKLLELIQKEQEPTVKAKLVFLKFFSEPTFNFEKCCQFSGIATSTGYLWVQLWNKNGYSGLQLSNNQGGRPSKLSDEDLKSLEKFLKEKDYWTTNEITALILEKFKVQLSTDQVSRILRNKLKMKFGKPYPHDYRKPKNAKMTLGKRLKSAFKKLSNKNIKHSETAIGFFDEAGAQNKANTVRIWSFKKIKIIKNTSKLKANSAGFYAIHGNSFHDFISTSNAKTVISFLKKSETPIKTSKLSL